MSEKSGSVAYVCECGKKWVIQQDALKSDSTFRCKCGRTVVVSGGAVYSKR